MLTHDLGSLQFREPKSHVLLPPCPQILNREHLSCWATNLCDDVLFAHIQPGLIDYSKKLLVNLKVFCTLTTFTTPYFSFALTGSWKDGVKPITHCSTFSE